MTATTNSRFLIIFRHGDPADAIDWIARLENVRHEFVVVEDAADSGAATDAFEKHAPHYYEGQTIAVVNVLAVPADATLPYRTTRPAIRAT